MASEKRENTVITDIGIEKVTVLSGPEGSDKKYKVKLQWTLNFGRVYEYDGVYEACVYENGSKTGITGSVAVSQENKVSGSTDLGPLEKGKKYTVTISVKSNDKTVESEPVLLLADGVTALQGFYQSGRLQLAWEPFPAAQMYLYCEVYKEGGTKKFYEFNSEMTSADLVLDSVDKSQPLCVTIYPADGSAFVGLASTLRFFPMGASLTSIARQTIAGMEAGEETTRVDIGFQFPCSESDRQNLKASLRFVRDGVTLLQTEPLEVTVEENTCGAEKKTAETKLTAESDVFHVQADISAQQIQPVFLEQAFVSVVLVCQGASSLSSDGLSCLPLAAPVLTAADYTRQDTILSVTYEVQAPLCGFRDVQDGRVCSDRIVKPNDTAGTVRVRPVFRAEGRMCLGAESNAVSAYCEGFFCEAGDGTVSIRYRQDSGTEGVARHTFTEELFLAHLSGEISNTAKNIILKPVGAQADRGLREKRAVQETRQLQDAQYVLEVHTDSLLTAEALDEFYRNLYSIQQEDGTDNCITVSGFYRIADAVWRLCRCSLGDVGLLSRQFQPGGRFCRILPGDVLCVETEVYTSQIDPRSEDISGYTLANTARYTVLAGEDDGCTVFNPFVSGMLQGMSQAARADANPLWMQAGILDLSHRIRYPFLYLMYPPNYYTSELPLCYQPSENVIIVGGDTYSALQDKVNAIAQDARLANDEQDAVAFFRGRSTITIEIPVFVDQTLYHVPVGTSVAGLLRQAGRYDGQGTRLYRLNAAHVYCPVFMDCPESVDAMLLTGGDRIETIR